MMLVVQNTTEFSFMWTKRETIGASSRVPNGLTATASRASPHNAAA
ncbi:hypothetical protein ACLF3G_27670 [Falsiroseomonas sp. HC035]